MNYIPGRQWPCEGIPANAHIMTPRKSLRVATLALLACAAAGALAQDHDHDHHEHRGPPSHREPGWNGGHGHGDVRFDGRYGHNHYYPSRGYVYGSLPVGAVSIGFGGGSYFFHGGVWYRPYSGRYIVVEPPLGIYLPVLPPDYATVWVGGAPYYYADGVYYSVAPGHGYVVVAPPAGVDTTQTVAPPAPQPVAPDPIFYPRNSQSAAQTEADRRDCNSWATTQPNAMADAKVFERATEACMDGRGYTMR
jgi:hypothetical protein